MKQKFLTSTTCAGQIVNCLARAVKYARRCSLQTKSPENFFATDLHIPRSNAIRIFDTGIRPIEYIGAYGLRDERETALMNSKWIIFEFFHQKPNNNIWYL